MRRVLIKISTRRCSPELGGCDRVIKKDEHAWLQIRTKRGTKSGGKSRRYLCEKCYRKVSR